ncbi:unknown [Clostridium sp. CAG:768]|nr:unknown [Clostridium sp. CAG:768]
MIPKISSSDNKNNPKQNIILASTGGIVWGTKEIFNTKNELLQNRNTYKVWLKTVTESKESELKREELYENILSLARKVDKINTKQNCEQHEREIINKLKNERKNFLTRNKECFKQQKNIIKKEAPFKIALKTLGGATIGLGISLLINYIKDRTKKK